jgi:hypothetical protein
VALTNFPKYIEIYPRKLLLSLNSPVKLNRIRCERFLSTLASLWPASKGDGMSVVAGRFGGLVAWGFEPHWALCWRFTIRREFQL